MNAIRSRILAVDDSASMRQILAAVLDEAGYAVTTARDGQDALTVAANGAFDLVLTDQHMPGMDGLSLIRALRELDTFAEVPILVLTTEVDGAYKDAAREAGASGWLIKPVDPGTLVDVVGSLVGAQAA
ncbi:Chemotaxis protein CheY [Pandoraea terrae]|uniref:Chemotaxis protein CheY n=1 Tax=Pandoraea terrae TaxID=1537710 RepID=A0A5E4W5Y0_9BURK|nr:response regulator [Pandoraea terrae]VVE19004.1 Chemotaxis protein CheY [Pandoraea terrae]